MTPQATGNLSGVSIRSTGMAIPAKKVTNEDLSKIVDTSDEWITQRTGIRSRHLLADDENLDDLAAHAVRQALQTADLDPGDLDLLICATTRPDLICPALACRIVERIDAVPCGAFDLNVACSGFVAAMGTADALIRSGAYRRIAVVGAEGLSRHLNWEDRRTCVLFGDAASCAILEASEDPSQGCLYQTLSSDAKRGRALYLPEKDSQIPEAERDRYNGQLGTLQMNGQSIYKFAVTVLTESVRHALEATDLTSEDISVVLPHQSNIRMLQSAWKQLGFAEDRIHINIDRFGNTGAASCGLCLHECLEESRLTAGDKFVFVAQGGGLSWGASVWQL